MQCKGTNRLLRGGPSSKKSYKVGCAILVKKLDAMEADKPKEEKCKDIRENKKKTLVRSWKNN